jgi:murein L,D-transpeptidase YcbB/YkuD
MPVVIVASFTAKPESVDAVRASCIKAIEAVLLARRETGRSAGALARWQAAHGLTADGIVGPVTLRAMGLAA